MKTASRWLRYCLISTLFAFASGTFAGMADPPARVARLNYIQGTVSFNPGTVDEWVPAQLNYPLSTGDRLWIDADSRAEMHAGSTSIQLAPNTDARLLNLDDRTVQIQLTQGTLEMRIFALRGDVYEIDTPNTAISFLQPGWYRVDVDPQGNTYATVREGGEAEAAATGTAFSVFGNQTARIYGTDSPAFKIDGARPLDTFDQWCLSRYHREDRVASLRYVSRELIGYEDLDGYGYWRDIPGYGPGWIPRPVAAGWAPFRYGRWCWIDPWGWTWIDDQPWGFATCHYGRWIHNPGWGWAWLPGPVVARPYYAPALVAFIEGENWGLSFAFGGTPVGWFPLGPGETYIPPYQVSNIYLRNVNYVAGDFHITDIYRIHRTYIHWKDPGAVTVVPQRAFAESDPVHKSMVRISQKQLASARIVGTAPRVAPLRDSILAGSNGALSFRKSARPPAAAFNRQVMVRRMPPPDRVPFVARQKLLDRNPGRPLAPAQLDKLRSEMKVSGPKVRRVEAVPLERRYHSGPQDNRAGTGRQKGQSIATQPREQRSSRIPARNEKGSERTSAQRRAPAAKQQPPQRLGRSQPPPPEFRQSRQRPPRIERPQAEQRGQRRSAQIQENPRQDGRQRQMPAARPEQQRIQKTRPDEGGKGNAQPSRQQHERKNQGNPGKGQGKR